MAGPVDGDRAAVTRVWRITRAVIPLAFVGVFFAWPVAAIIGRSWSAGALGDVLADEGFRRVVWFTFWQSVVATGLTLLAGLPAAYVVARYEFPGACARPLPPQLGIIRFERLA